MKKIKVGIAGLGRLGKVHANNIAFKIPNAELTAACSIVPAELEYAKEKLGVTDVYTDYREMLAKADIDAVVIVTTSSTAGRSRPRWTRASMSSPTSRWALTLRSASRPRRRSSAIPS